MGPNINTKRTASIVLVLFIPIFLLYWIDTFRVLEYAGLFGAASFSCGVLFMLLFLGVATKKIK
jgi:hypothetical protein